MATVALSGIITPSNVVTETSTETLTNKTLTAPTIASANLTTALTLAGAAGTNGQVLTSAGSGLPTWSSPSSGALTLLSTVTASNSATVDVETTFSSTYDAYLLVISGVRSQNNNQSLKARMKLSGSYDSASNYTWNASTASSSNASGGLTAASLGGTTTEIYIGAGEVGNGATFSLNAQIKIYTPSSTTLSKMIDWTGASISSADVYAISGFGQNYGTGALTGLRFFFPTGNIVSGKFRLYGISNS